MIPLAATIVLVARARSLDERLQAFLAATVSITVCIVPVVAVFASRVLRPDRGAEHVLRRAAPLHRAPRLGRARCASAPRPGGRRGRRLSALLVVAIPFDRFLTTSAITDTLMLLPFWSLQDRIGDDWIALAALGLAAALAAAFLFVPRRYALALPLCSSSASGSSRSGRSGGGRTASSASRAARSSRGSATADRDWVDQALAPGARQRSSGRGEPIA